ncbi:MAG TPA: DUF885 domain-containing protein [Acidimicrobiales bacterium]|nr:DUF885 domain-containing protein [Acidimicrobiales bacterium]
MVGVREIGDTYIEEMAAADPIAATAWGVDGHDDRLPDLSPIGLEARADLQRSTLAVLTEVEMSTDTDRVAAEVMAERLGADLELHASGDDFRSLRVIHSPPGSVRQVFDLMALETEADWEVVATRLRAVPGALDGFRATLRDGLSRGLSSAQRQVVACADQYDSWGGREDADNSFFATLVRRHPGGPTPALESAARSASQAYLELGTWLRRDYLPAATPIDPVGRERYALCARYFTGSDLDLEDTYEFGWAEMCRIEARMAEICHQLVPGASLPEVVDHIEADPARVIDGTEAFRRWNQELIDSTITALDGVHFDIAEPIRRCEAMIAPPGGAAAMYYTGPSEDLSRPGRTWYPTLGKTRFPLWREVSICYHEGVPGHHLQVAQVRYLSDRLTRFQRLAGFTSGHGEGWALYAERLMGELGYLDDPAFELGMLSAQAMRAVRIVVDIGMHLELRIPAEERYHPGERWTPALALPFVIERSCFPTDFMASEVDRYLGLPGQAISYKVGERVWLEGRQKARERKGSAFDLKDFHRYALDLGGMGLDQLARELGRY